MNCVLDGDAYGFLLAFSARTGLVATFQTAGLSVLPGRGRPKKGCVAKPIAPYSRDPGRALGTIFDRITGDSVDPDQLKTYAEALAQYHLSPEDKFLNGRFLDRGRTERRHVVATHFLLIGKEANQVGESGEASPIWSALEQFSTRRRVDQR